MNHHQACRRRRQPLPLRLQHLQHDGQWAQLDTGQDTPWFGQWAHPFERRILRYAEGDLSCTECGTGEEFTAEFDRIADFHRNNDEWKGIDPWSTALERFVAAGAVHLVQAACFQSGGTRAEAETATSD